MSKLKDQLAELIRFPSVTPEDHGCQELIIQFLEHIGFECERLNCPPVSNFFATIGTQGPLLMFAGHTDVVPVGAHHQWRSDPFTLTEQAGILFGRGVADMKGSIVCMLLAVEKFIQDYPNFTGQIGFLITSGEEGDLFDLGTPYVMEKLKEKGIKPEFCILGEPSSTQQTGDVIKVGRRGSLSGKLTLQGIQGHVAYPHLADNPIHNISPALAELSNQVWDEGNAFFPPTTLQMTHIQSGGQAGNVIPGELQLNFNVRYSTEQTDRQLMDAIYACFERHKLKPTIDWRLNGMPFLTSKGRLLDSTVKTIQNVTGQVPERSTTGGTSDGRFIAPFGVEVIELGPTNKTIHQVNESVALADLEVLTELYYGICADLFQ